jgi:hypothetical protein
MRGTVENRAQVFGRKHGAEKNDWMIQANRDRTSVNTVTRLRVGMSAVRLPAEVDTVSYSI